MQMVALFALHAHWASMIITEAETVKTHLIQEVNAAVNIMIGKHEIRQENSIEVTTMTKKCKYCKQSIENWEDYCEQHKELVFIIEDVVINLLDNREEQERQDREASELEDSTHYQE